MAVLKTKLSRLTFYGINEMTNKKENHNGNLKEQAARLQANTTSQQKITTKENKNLKISYSNIQGLNKSNKLGAKMAHILDHLDSEVKIIIDAHTTKHTLNTLRKEYNTEITKYKIEGHLTK